LSKFSQDWQFSDAWSQAWLFSDAWPQDWQFSGAWAQLPPVHFDGRLPRCAAQPLRPANKTTAESRSIARFMSDASFFSCSGVGRAMGLDAGAPAPLPKTSALQSLESRKSADPAFPAGAATSAQPADVDSSV
jgi:hypothetical protein